MQFETHSAFITSQEWDWLQAQSESLGFLESAILPLIPEPRFEHYAEWVQNQHHEPLHYLGQNMDKRADPRKLGTQLESAIVFLHPYPTEFSSEYIARYAWGGDYHVTIREKIRKLSLKFQASFRTFQEEKACVDTIPLLERSLAERSGLGWIGKNGCLISRQHGSFFLLAVWLISLKTPDQLQPTSGSFHCGTCTRCLDACPTQAFIKPGTIEVQKCLSTQTIENRSTIHPEFFKSIQSQAFGCDICQTVCPWNRHKTPTINQEYLPDLRSLLSCSEMDFRSHFRKTALERPGWAGLRRNFLILAAHDKNIPDEIFTMHLSHSNAIVQQTAQDILKWRNI